MICTWCHTEKGKKKCLINCLQKKRERERERERII